jgi:hypothetical protein
MALTDTAVQRIGAGLGLGGNDRTPEQRRDDANTRLVLATALPDRDRARPGRLARDLLTHTTLTADGQRNAAKGKSADSQDAGC